MTHQFLRGRQRHAGVLRQLGRGQPDSFAPASGFTLARPVTEISLADIVEAVEGPIAMTMCSGSDGPSECALDANCRVKPHMGIVSNAVRGALDAVSLQSLAGSR